MKFWKYILLLNYLIAGAFHLCLTFTVSAQPSNEDSLVVSESGDVKSIRISVLPFIYTNTNATDYTFLIDSIPSMLVSGLSSSRGFQLIEDKNSADISRRLEKASKGFINASFYNDSTLLSIGEELLSNYIIYGTYWTYRDYIRIDLRCVSLESKEIISSNGIDVDSITALSRKIDEVSDRLRQKIEFDILESNRGLKNVGVIVVDPNVEARFSRQKKLFFGETSTLLEKKTAPIYSTFTRKLRANSKLRIKEGAKIYRSSDDKWNIANELGVQYLISFEFEAYADDNYLVNIELFDTRIAQLLYSNSETIKYHQSDITNFLNNQIGEILALVDLTGDNNEHDYTSIKTPIFFRRWHIGHKQSTIQRSESGKRLFLQDGIGRYSEWFINYRIGSRLSFEFQLGRDHGKSINLNNEEPGSVPFEENDDNVIVTSRQQSLTVHYDFYKSGALSLYGGVGATFFGVGRAVDTQSGNEEQAGQTGYGGIIMTGAQISLEKFLLTVYLEPRFVYGSRIRDVVTESGFQFSGGRLGGFYSTFGIGFNLPL